MKITFFVMIIYFLYAVENLYKKYFQWHAFQNKFFVDMDGAWFSDISANLNVPTTVPVDKITNELQECLWKKWQRSELWSAKFVFCLRKQNLMF